jgi:hypothetical protein
VKLGVCKHQSEARGRVLGVPQRFLEDIGRNFPVLAGRRGHTFIEESPGRGALRCVVRPRRARSPAGDNHKQAEQGGQH